MSDAYDVYSHYEYAFDNLDRVTAVDNMGTARAPNVVLAYAYYRNGLTKTVDASIDGTSRLRGPAIQGFVAANRAIWAPCMQTAMHSNTEMSA